jgi:Autographiviridae RNA polymerase
VKVLTAVERKTLKRFVKRERRKTKKGATFGSHAEGRAISEIILPTLATLIESTPPPEGLERVIHQLRPQELAMVALGPLLHQIAVGPTAKKKRHGSSALMQLKIAIGVAFHDKLITANLLKEDRGAYRRLMQADNIHKAIWKWRKKRWPQRQYLLAGSWLYRCAMNLDIFGTDADGFPWITKEAEDCARQLLGELIWRKPAYLPSKEPLNNWTGWRAGGYWDDGTRISAPFFSRPDPETETAVKRAFRNGSMQQHVDGVNALQRVPFVINQRLVPVVERWGGKIGKPVSDLLLTEDMETAKWLGSDPFRVPMNCDFRGRVYGVTHFNFQREDHVRSLFQFAQGMPIGKDGLDWLMIHVANCGDFDRISKRPFSERIAWAESHRFKIIRTARDQIGTVDWWRDADAPFSFVAGCIELAAAWESGPSYVTRLPVCFDGSCNGVQHLAMMMRDEHVARLVNLMPSDKPQDVYQVITDRVIGRLKESGDEHAEWWLGMRLISRKLVKRPAMTFAYSATVSGMRDQLLEVYREMRQKAEPREAAATSLAKHIRRAAKEILPGPAVVMNFIRKLARDATNRGEVLRWTTPTGFPWANRYHEPIVETVHHEIRGEYMRHRIADGYSPNIRKTKCMNAAAPNFVHAMDAAHLIRVVNAAANEGIQVGSVHDCFACLAPQARDLRRIIREEFARLYSGDVLADLRDAAGSNEPLPKSGSYDPWSVLKAKYCF